MHKHGFELVAALEHLGVELSEINPVQYGHRFTAIRGVQRVVLTVYETKGNIQVQGSETDLKSLVSQMVDDISAGRPLGQYVGNGELGTIVPALVEGEVDEVVREYMEEAIACVLNGTLLGGIFLLGGAWERMLRLVMGALVQAFPEPEQPTVRKRLLDKNMAEAQRNLVIEIKQVRAQVKDLPPEWENCLTVADYHRRTRNDVGHPDRVMSGIDDAGCRLAVYTSKQYLLTLQGMIRAFENVETPLVRGA